MAENVTIRCTNYCGFEVTGDKEFAASLFENHVHQKESHREGSHWYEYVFSMWGLFIMVVVAGAVTSYFAHH